MLPLVSVPQVAVSARAPLFVPQLRATEEPGVQLPPETEIGAELPAPVAAVKDTAPGAAVMYGVGVMAWEAIGPPASVQVIAKGAVVTPESVMLNDVGHDTVRVVCVPVPEPAMIEPLSVPGTTRAGLVGVVLGSG